MLLKRRVRRKDGKEHVYYSVCESLRVHGGRTIQRQILHLGELNTRQLDSWQRTLEVIHEDANGLRRQGRLFTDREGSPGLAGRPVREWQPALLTRHPAGIGAAAHHRQGIRPVQRAGPAGAAFVKILTAAKFVC